MTTPRKITELEQQAIDRIKTAHTPGPRVICPACDVDGKVTLEMRRLIAAAPDLLAALKEVMDTDTLTNAMHPGQYGKYKALIAQAERTP